MKPLEPRITYIAFQECEIRGTWHNKIDDIMTHGGNSEDVPSIIEKDNAEYYISSKMGSELWVVRPDGLRKGWSFKENSMIVIRGNTVRFHQESVIDDFAINEDEQIK